LKVKGYREVEKEEIKEDRALNSEISRKTMEKQVLLQGPGEKLEGAVCPACIRKGRKGSYIGIGFTLLILLTLLVSYVLFQGLPGIFIRVGLFLSLILLVIFIMPLFRNKQIEVIDQFFLKARAEKEEPVLSVQDLNYYFGRKVVQWLMIRESHWEELEDADEEGVKILGMS